MTTGPSIQGIQLTRTFGEGEALTVAVRDICLELYAGQVTLIMGPSGCGKSTLMAILSGLLHPHSGQALVCGHDLYQFSDKERRAFRLLHFGFIFQEFNLFPTLTVWEQLEMVLCWGQGLSRKQAMPRVAAILERLNMTRKAHQLPAQLSGGEKQRVAIGRALIKSPGFCFADEPTSALDWEKGKAVVGVLRDSAHEHGATVLIVSHDPRIPSYADQVIHLEDGRRKEAGGSFGQGPGTETKS
jgi:putative ABC transport system ATP-binding protein